MANAKKQANPLNAIRSRYPHVRRVTETGKKGQATRVEIQCVEEGCKEKREIATQDAFQVSRCHAHQREEAKRRRRKTPVTPEPMPKSPKARKRRARKAA